MFIKNIKENRWIFLTALISIFFYFYNLGLSEFVNDETIAINYLVRVMYGSVNPLFAGSLFIYAHPPVRLLVNIPFALLFGMSETALRFPHALFGSLAIFPLYHIGLRLYGKQTALLASLLYAISGASAVNRQAQGVGIYVFFILLAFYYLIQFINENEPTQASRYLLFVSISLIVASYTYLEAIMFVLPVIYFIIKKKGMISFLKDKGTQRASALYIIALMTYFALWNIMPQIAHKLGYIHIENAGNISHLSERLSSIGAFNLFNIFTQYIQYNSWFYFLILLMGFVAVGYSGWREKETRINMIYLFPHLIVWVVLFKNIMMHPMYDLALIALLAASGLIKLSTWFKTHSQLLGWGFSLIIGFFMVLSAWHHYLAHNQNQIPLTITNGIFSHTVNRPIQIGSKTAGYFIRTNSQSAADTVFTSGTGAVDFYSGRLHVKGALPRNAINTVEDISILTQAQSWESVRYMVITTDNYVLWEYAQQNYALEAIVTVRGNPSLYLFNTLRLPTTIPPQILPSEQYDTEYDDLFNDWHETLPWFLLLVKERL